MGRSRRKILAVLFLLLGGWWVAFSSEARWAAFLLQGKFAGALPYVRWFDLLPETVLPGTNWLAFVRMKESSEGPCPILWDTPIGPFWGRSEDHRLLWDLLVEQYFHRVYQRRPVVVRRGDIVFDVGSHLGTFSRFALREGARLVVAFEPEPTNIACFKRTFRTEIEQGRVILVEAAVWENQATLNLNLPAGRNSGGASVLPAGEKPNLLSVPATTIDDTVQRLGLERVDFVKMDIEGAERHALRGARRTLSRFGPRMAVCTYHKADDPVVIPQVILEARPDYHIFKGTTQAYFY